MGDKKRHGKKRHQPGWENRKKKRHAKALKSLEAQKEKVAQSLAQTAAALMPVYQQLHAEGASAETLIAVSKMGVGYSMAARMVRGDIQLELLSVPFPPQPAHTEPEPEKPKDDEGGAPHTGLYL